MTDRPTKIVQRMAMFVKDRRAETASEIEIAASGDILVGLASWIIQDGNYSDFHRTQVAPFAIEFYQQIPFELSIVTSVSMRRSGATVYEVSGQIIHATDKWWAVDFGLLMFQESKIPDNLRKGDWIRGIIEIGIDPFYYFESLSLEADAPALIYDWSIEKIDMQTAPFAEVSPKVFARDYSLSGWKEVAETDAWTDDGGHADYLLHCRRIPGIPRKTLATGE